MVGYDPVHHYGQLLLKRLFPDNFYFCTHVTSPWTILLNEAGLKHSLFGLCYQEDD